MNKINAGFIGAGGIARSHVFSLNSLKYYYNDFPDIDLVNVSSFTSAGREDFARRYGFRNAMPPEDFFKSDDVDTVFILGPNSVHYSHLEQALKMPSVERIYIEKPVCSDFREEELLRDIAKSYPSVRIQCGFQYLFTPAIREALRLWQTGTLGNAVHFGLKYFHGDYLKKQYRDRRASRLTPAPDGGAMADLGSHAISLLNAFLGNGLRITGAVQAGDFADVIKSSDLFSMISVADRQSGAAGSISASRVASGSGDTLSIELYAERGALRYSSQAPEYFEYFTEESGLWHRAPVGSTYAGISTFPSGHVAPGWLRPMIHAHYVFLTGSRNEPFIPDLAHGLDVQRLVRETSEHLETFRKLMLEKNL